MTDALNRRATAAAWSPIVPFAIPSPTRRASRSPTSSSIRASPTSSAVDGSALRPAARAAATTEGDPKRPPAAPTGSVTYGELKSIRSWNIHRVPTVHPSSISPNRSVSGTTTSVRNSWQNSSEPFSISMRCTSMPG